MKKILGWLLIALVVALVAMLLAGMSAVDSPLWTALNLLEIVVYGWAGYTVLKTQKTLAWFLIAAPILIIISWILNNNALWLIADAYLIIVGLVAGYMFLKKPA